MIQYACSDDFLQVHIQGFNCQYYASFAFNYQQYFGGNVPANEFILNQNNYDKCCKYHKDFDGKELQCMIKRSPNFCPFRESISLNPDN